MFITIAAVLFVLWVLGLIGHVGGGLVNILIVAASSRLNFDNLPLPTRRQAPYRLKQLRALLVMDAESGYYTA